MNKHSKIQNLKIVSIYVGLNGNTPKGLGISLKNYEHGQAIVDAIHTAIAETETCVEMQQTGKVETLERIQYYMAMYKKSLITQNRQNNYQGLIGFMTEVYYAESKGWITPTEHTGCMFMYEGE